MWQVSQNTSEKVGMDIQRDETDGRGFFRFVTGERYFKDKCEIPVSIPISRREETGFPT